MDQFLNNNKEDEGIQDVDVITTVTATRPKRSVSKPIYVDLNDDDDEEAGGNEDDNDDDDDDVDVSPPSKKKSKANNGLTATPKTTKKEKGGPTLEQERRRIGDAVKSRISFQKWTIDASCHSTIDMKWETFKDNIVPHSTSVVPVDLVSLSSPPEVAVARISGSHDCGEAFGKSKIVGGSRVRQWSVRDAEVVWRRGEPSKCDIWFTMF